MKLYSGKSVRAMFVASTVVVFALTLVFANLYGGRYRHAVVTLCLLSMFCIGILVGAMLVRNLIKDGHDPEVIPQELLNCDNPDIVVSNTADENLLEGWDGFDESDANYPEELDIAMQAWRAVSIGNNGRPVKEQLENYIRVNHPHIAKSNAALERIAIIANWTTGGRPKKNVEKIG